MCRDQLLLVNAVVVFRKAWRSDVYIRASKASLVNIGFMVVLAWIPGSFHSINRMDP
ncbi:hypothetical protein RhiirC2_732300 [Rhizophagus irregularis]|uniref:Uncharacterized protein n=1 Tax=Rhizophagus irregularis TaxID=588596 RepID=A0A2N1NTV1_9GLOM|nr:hypothetical protein RhiirC2_732300 [Rhizophagus irregularis]